MADYLLGIDFGTGGAKSALIDAQGRDLGYAFEEYSIIQEQPNWSEHDATLYWPVACRLIRKAVQSAGVDPREIRGIAVSSALPSMVMVDEDNNPIFRAYNLMDKRADSTIEWIRNTIGEDRTFVLSGYRLEDHPNFVNLLWEKENRPDGYRRISKVLTIDGYIVLKLTGKATIHQSGAAFYGVAYDLRKRVFDDDMLARIGVDRSLLPRQYKSEDIVGEVTREAAEDAGLVPGIPVAAGQVDCNASWLGAGAIEPGDVQSNLGTVGNFGIIHTDEEFAFTEHGRKLMTFPYTTNHNQTLITVPTTTSGGQSLRYLRDAIGQAEIEAERRLGLSAYDQFMAQAGEVPPGSEGLVVLPFLMGERTPIWDPDARGVIFGLSLHHGKGHLIRAFMEGVAFAMYDSFRIVREAGMKVRFPMILNEGGAVSRLWRSIITDVFDVETAMVKRRTGAPFGDAVLAGVATGVLPGFHVTRDWVELKDRLQPNAENHERYMAVFDVYKSVYNHIKDDFQQLKRLRTTT